MCLGVTQNPSHRFWNATGINRGDVVEFVSSQKL
jgi:hypothetical protein